MAEELESELLEQVKPIVTGMGFTLVELRMNRSKRQSHVSVVVYRSDGVGVNDCAAISRNLLPRLELMAGLDNLRLQVSSPGLNRVLRSPAEYEIFKGRSLKVWRKGSDDWIIGINGGVVEGLLQLDRSGEITQIHLNDIQKAKLD
jgi:ribosome maturation factor RimP